MVLTFLPNEKFCVNSKPACLVIATQRLLGVHVPMLGYLMTPNAILETSCHFCVSPPRPSVTMTTPGRTHIPWYDQNGQINELLSYIGFLEAKVSYLQQHHERCNSWLVEPMTLVPDVPYLPPDLIVNHESNDLVDYSFNQPSQTQVQAQVQTQAQTQLQTPSSTPTSSPTTSLAKPPQKSPPGNNNPRWKRIVDQITAGWDDPASWTSKRASLGLDTTEQNNHTLMLILGLQNWIPSSWNQTPLPLPSTNPHPRPITVTNTTDSLILSARQYALDTKASGTNSALVSQIHNFRELVFASLCVVMEQQGLPINTINELMRICMSSSGAANLYRLRRGALWVNRVIRGLIVKGWGHGATELFLLCMLPSPQASPLTFPIWKKTS